MNTLEAANLKPGEALWVWDGAAELDTPVWAWDGQWLRATVLEVQTGGGAVSVTVRFESAASITLPAIDIQPRDPSSYGIDKPRAAKPGRVAAAKRILATWCWSGGGRRGPVWTFQGVDGNCSECGHHVDQLQRLRLRPALQRVRRETRRQLQGMKSQTCQRVLEAICPARARSIVE